MISVQRLVWDAWNVGHIARHDVTPEEVEEVCHREFVSSETYDGRLRLIGPTNRARMLTVIPAPPGADAYYPGTARPASRKERRRHDELTQGSSL